MPAFNQLENCSRIRSTLTQIAADHVGRDGLVLPRSDGPARLTPLDVHEQAAIIAALSPCHRLLPVDIHLAERGDLLGIVLQDEIAFPAEPLIEDDAAIHALGAVIRDDQY